MPEPHNKPRCNTHIRGRENIRSRSPIRNVEKMELYHKNVCDHQLLQNVFSKNSLLHAELEKQSHKNSNSNVHTSCLNICSIWTVQVISRRQTFSDILSAVSVVLSELGSLSVWNLLWILRQYRRQSDTLKNFFTPNYYFLLLLILLF